jgi:hypothetical protein
MNLGRGEDVPIGRGHQARKLNSDNSALIFVVPL